MTETRTTAETPLEAYATLREEGSASFLLESVVHGRLGRHSFAGSGDRVVSFEEARACGERVHELSTGHFPMLTTPYELAELLVAE